MRKLILTLSVYWVSISADAQSGTITLEDLWLKYSYFPASISGIESMADGRHYTLQRTQSGNTILEKYSYSTGEKVQDIIDSKKLKDLGVKSFDSYQLSTDEKKILIASETESIYRYSSRSFFYVYDIDNNTIKNLNENQKQMNAVFSPDGKKVAYIINNDIYVNDLNRGTETRITFDGKVNEIINGAPDWVYEEEFTMKTAMFWSPDAKKIAYLRFDETEVPEFVMPIFGGQLYPHNYTFKYPKVGEKNSIVTVHIHNLETSNTTDIKIPKAYEYIPRIYWTNQSDELVIFTMNRLQNDLELFITKSNNPNPVSFFKEKSATYLEIHDNLTFLPDDQSFIWTSEADGFMHIYHYDKKGKLIRKITSGKWDVTAFLGFDSKTNTLFYESAEISPLERHIYNIGLNGRNKTQLTKNKGTHTANFSSTFDFFVATHSSKDSPPTYAVFNRKGEMVRVMEKNEALREKLEKLDIQKPEFLSIPNAEGLLLNAYMMKPKNFDLNQKYPVLMFVYGGPGSQTVQDKYDAFNGMWFQMLTQMGYIVVSVDNRGTGARGRDFRVSTYEQLGKQETEDQIAAAEYLGKLSYIDEGRIGIFGWSYGGYMSSLCITKGANVFKMAIAVAPVTNWKFYDTIYTERYMGTKETNPKGYDANAPIAFANKLKGKYLLIHGTADDNVHWQNAAEMINALVASNKQFDQFIYPDRNHGIYGGYTRYHLYKLMTDYILQNL